MPNIPQVFLYFSDTVESTMTLLLLFRVRNCEVADPLTQNIKSLESRGILGGRARSRTRVHHSDNQRPSKNLSASVARDIGEQTNI